MTLSKQTAIEVDKSSGFHVFEFHWATTGMSVFTVLLIVGMVALFILCFNWCQRRRRQFASYMSPFAAVQHLQHMQQLQPLQLQQMQPPLPLQPPRMYAPPPQAPSAVPPQPFRPDDTSATGWRDV